MYADAVYTRVKMFPLAILFPKWGIFLIEFYFRMNISVCYRQHTNQKQKKSEEFGKSLMKIKNKSIPSTEIWGHHVYCVIEQSPEFT